MSGVRSHLIDLLICRRILEIEGEKWDLKVVSHIPILVNGDRTIWPVKYEIIEEEYENVTSDNVMSLVSSTNKIGIYAHTIDDIKKVVEPSLIPKIRDLIESRDDPRLQLSDPMMVEWIANSIVMCRLYKVLETIL